MSKAGYLPSVRTRAFAVTLAAALALFTSNASAAARALEGVVVAPSGDPIAGARVTILDAQGVALAKVVTDAKGRWHLTLADGSNPPRQARVEVEGLPRVSAEITEKTGSIRTIVIAASEAPITIEVQADKPVEASSIEAQPVHYTVDATLMSKLPGTRNDPFAAATSLPSMGRPPALSTVYIVRGAGPEETATYLDGAPMPHAFHFGGLVAVIPSGMVDAISIAPGGFGVAYGRATAGLVDVSLASPKRDGVHASLGFDAIDVALLGSTPIGEHTRVMVGARRSHVDVWIGKLLGDQVAGDLPRYLDGQLIVEHDFGKRARVRVGLLGADDSVSVTDPNRPADQPRSGSWKSGLVRAHARFDAQLGETGTLLGVVALTRSHDEIVGELDQWDDVRRSMFFRVEAGAGLSDEARLTVGVDSMATHIDGVRVLQIPISSFGGSEVFPLRGAIAVDRYEPGAYAQLQLKPFPELTITPGIRVDRAYLGEVVVQPRVAIRAEVAAHTALRLVGGVYARPNTFDSVNARDYQGALLPIVADAGPAKSVHVGAGFEQQLTDGVDLITDVYARTSRDVLVPLQQPARPLYEDRKRAGATVDFDTQRVLVGYEYPLYAPTGRTRAVGVELLLRWRIDSLVGFVGYALSRAEVRDDAFSDWRRAPLDQTHVLNAAALWQLGHGWELGARFRLAVGIQDSPYPATEIAPKNDPNLAPNRALPQLPPLHSLDLRLEKTWVVLARGTFSAYIEVRNVYDHRSREPLAYNYVYDYPVVGNGLPIIPNLGVKGAF